MEILLDKAPIPRLEPREVSPLRARFEGAAMDATNNPSEEGATAAEIVSEISVEDITSAI